MVLRDLVATPACVQLDALGGSEFFSMMYSVHRKPYPRKDRFHLHGFPAVAKTAEGGLGASVELLATARVSMSTLLISSSLSPPTLSTYSES